MKKCIPIFLCLFMLCSCGNITTTTDTKAGQLITISSEEDITIGDNLSPAILGVYASTSNSGSIGAGVCVTQNGHILTNSHVINGANNIVLYQSNGDTVSAEILYEDTVLDFAILKANKNLPYLKINDTGVEVGETVVAVGTPISLMLKHTYTKGIVSAINRTIKIATTSGEAYMQNLIQHDASLNPGNSGGPLINEKGEVVGINTLKISSGEGIGFAIPCKSFTSILSQFVETNTISAPYLGVYGYDAEIAKFNKLSTTNKGFYIESVNSSSPAYNILHEGDTIISINGVSIDNAVDFRHELYSYQDNNYIELEYLSNNQIKSCKIKLVKR